MLDKVSLLWPSMPTALKFQRVILSMKWFPWPNEKVMIFLIWLMRSQKVASAFGATNTPHVFLLQKDGDGFKVAYIGAIDNNPRDAQAADKKFLEDAVDALAAGKSVTNSKTKGRWLFHQMEKLIVYCQKAFFRARLIPGLFYASAIQAMLNS